MKILLTGASGLLGNAYAVAAIRRGHSVTALYNSREPIVRGIEQSVQIDDLVVARCDCELRCYLFAGTSGCRTETC